jgi:thioredoxin 1
LSNIKRLIIIAIVVALFVAAFLVREARSPKSTEEPASQQAPETAAEIIAGGDQEAKLPRLVDLGANTCIPCKMMAPILEELKQEYRGSLIVEVIDLREDREAAKEYGVRVIPTQIFYDASGTERFRHEGFMSKEAILAAWKRVGVDLPPKSDSGS